MAEVTKLRGPARYVDPNTPILKQIENLRAMATDPPENSRRVTFDPKLAAYVLDPQHKFSHRNRSLRPLKIKRYAEAMAEHRWLLTGEAIKFGRSGLLLDGYHRLTSCVRANVRFESVVMFGVDDGSFHAMDTGTMRGGGDVLALAGFSRSALRAAATRWWMILTSERPDDRSLSPTNEEILDVHKRLHADPHFAPGLRDAEALYRKSKHFPMASMLAFLFIYSCGNQRAVGRFVEDGLNEKGDAEKLKQRLAEISAANLGRVHENARNARIILTLNAYCTGVRLRSVGSRRAPFWDTETPFPAFQFQKGA